MFPLIDFILPSIISILQSDNFANSLLWVAKIISLLLFFKPNKILKTFLADIWSRFPVGSSARIIFGLFIKALAIAILWFSPPDNSDGKWSKRLDKPRFDIVFLASFNDVLLSLFYANPAKLTFSKAVKSGNKL